MDTSSQPDIVIEQISDIYLIFNLGDVEMLRQKYRIIGCLCGCLPLAVHQNEQYGLPLKLLDEEVYYLIEKSYGRVFRRKCGIEGRNNAKAKDFFEHYRRIQVAEQSLLCYNDKIEEQMTKLNEIASGRAAKEMKRIRNPTNASANVLRVTENDLKNVSVSDDDKIKVEREIRSQTMRTLHDDEILTETFDIPPHSSNDDFEEIKVQFPNETKPRLKYCVFKKLHDQGNFLTSGFKFGVDFLVYPGDPLKYHASHVAVVVGKSEKLTDVDKFAYCRLGSQVKKIVLLCTWNDDETDVLFETVEWEKK